MSESSHRTNRLGRSPPTLRVGTLHGRVALSPRGQEHRAVSARILQASILAPSGALGDASRQVTTEQIIGFCIALFIMLIGVAGCLLPILPGTPIVWAAAVAHRLYFGDTGPSTLVLIVLTVLTILSLIFDQLASVVGAKKLGATWKGVTGAVVGGLVGLFFNLPGIILGPFIGATLFELFGDREFRDALRAGVGATLGLVFGVVGKVAVSMVMMLMFSWSVVTRSLEANETEPTTAPAPPAQETPTQPSNSTAWRSNACPAVSQAAVPRHLGTFTLFDVLPHEPAVGRVIALR